MLLGTAVRGAWAVLAASLALALACSAGRTAAPAPTPAAAAPAAAAATSAPAAPASADSVPLNAPIRMQTVRNSADAALFIATELGYFEEQGLSVDWEPVRSAADTIPLLSTGGLEVAAGGSSPGLFNAVQRGVNLKIVTDKTRNTPGGHGSSFIVRQDLLDSGAIKSASDWVGRPVAVTTLRSAAGLYLFRALQEVGLSLSDVEPIDLSAPDTMAALANRKVDVAFLFEPFQALVQQQGLGQPRVWVDELYPNSVTNFLMYSGAFATDRPEAARRFMIAHVRGMRYFWDHYTKGRDPDAVLNIMVSQKVIPSLALGQAMRLSSGSPDGAIGAADFALDQEIYRSLGWQDRIVSLDGIIDQRFAKQAVEALGGPYPQN